MLLPREYRLTSHELMQDQYAYDLWCEEGLDGMFYKHLINALHVAIAEELTGQQRAYILAYYYDRNTQEEIAKKYSVNKSTVSRTIRTAEKKLEHVLRYASPRLLKASEQRGICRRTQVKPQKEN